MTTSPMTRQRRWLGWLFYGTLLLLMVLILAAALDLVLPTELARRIGYNSEGYTLAILLGAWIQFARPRLDGSTRWVLTFLVAAASLTLALTLFTSDLPSRFKTLNETFFALSLLLPYVTLARPLRRWPPVVSAVLLVVVVAGVALGSGDSPVVLLAETMAVFVLAPLAFDWVDRAILDPQAQTSTGLRYAWYALLIAIPLVVVLLGDDAREGGGVHEVLQYVGRVHEAVIGLLLVQLYFAVGLRRTGTVPPPRTSDAQ